MQKSWGQPLHSIPYTFYYKSEIYFQPPTSAGGVVIINKTTTRGFSPHTSASMPEKRAMMLLKQKRHGRKSSGELGKETHEGRSEAGSGRAALLTSALTCCTSLHSFQVSPSSSSGCTERKRTVRLSRAEPLPRNAAATPSPVVPLPSVGNRTPPRGPPLRSRNPTQRRSLP